MELHELAKALLTAKQTEADAKSVRLAVEAELLAAFNPTKVEGCETKATAGFKVKVTTKLTRKLDYEAYKALDLPPNLAFVVFKPELDMKSVRAIEKVDPTLLATCVTTTPAKPSIDIEEVA